MTNLARGLTGTERSIARAAMRLMALRPKRENTVNRRPA